VPTLTSALIASAAIAIVAAVATREHRLLRASRRALLSGCAHVLDRGRITHSGDDFPGLTGTHRGRAVHVVLVPDTMTIRRLPQLWLSVTMLDPQPALPGLSLLVRQCGAEFYALTHSFEHRLEAPAGFPDEVMIRGSDARAERLLEALASPLRQLLSDAHVKEIAITARGLRIVRQAGEGRRGEHLLLRQAVFDQAEVPPSDLEAALSALELLRGAIANIGEARAA
jgi:hypothetical protein